MPAIDLTQQRICDCILRSIQEESPGGRKYFRPPQTGGTIYEALPLWQRVAAALRAPVAKQMDDEYFFVVLPSTTEEQMREQYLAKGGQEAFEKALEAAHASL